MGICESKNQKKNQFKGSCPAKLLLRKLKYKLEYDLEGIYCKLEPLTLPRIGANRQSINKPTYIFKFSLYMGEILEFKPDGLGYMITEEGFYYEGYFSFGLFNGKGRLINNIGWIIEGTWNKGHLLSGKITNFHQKVFQGQLKNYEPNGKGIEKAKDYEYEGDYLNGKKQGKGKVVWKDGSFYEGEFFMGRVEGMGKHRWLDSEYDGHWRAGKMHGTGIYKWDDGRWYEGELREGLKDGFGKYYDGTKIYSGFWKNGKEDGKGQLQEGDKIIEGIWKSGKLLKNKEIIPNEHFNNEFDIDSLFIPSRIIEKCKEVLELRQSFSQFKWEKKLIRTHETWKIFDDCEYFGEENFESSPHGLGILINPKFVYEGNFDTGLKSGFGRMIKNDGEMFLGDWESNMRNGFGVLTKWGNIYVGECKNDKFDGIGRLDTKMFIYDGSWSQGLQEGQGTMLTKGKSTYIGEFKQGEISGLGTLHYTDGRSILAEWLSGKPVKILEKQKISSFSSNLQIN